MKVLHLPLEVAGQVREICKQLNHQGIQAAGFNWRNSYFGYDDFVMQSDAYEMANELEDAIQYFDIFHYHTGYTVFNDKSDILMALDAGKKVIMHHRGNDVRLPSYAKKMNPYVYTGDSQPEEQIKKNLEFFSKYLDVAIVQDYELYDYVRDYYRKVHILPRLIDTKQIRPLYETKVPHVPLVVHAPTSRLFKGTQEIIKAVTALQKEIEFEFKLVEFSTRNETLKWFQTADIVIDQILCGAYGNVSVEAMALGKPVICNLRQDIQLRSPQELPIISANPDNLYEKLKYLIQHPEIRRETGRKGRHYVEKYHESSRVILDLIKIYQSLLNEPSSLPNIESHHKPDPHHKLNLQPEHKPDSKSEPALTLPQPERIDHSASDSAVKKTDRPKEERRRHRKKTDQQKNKPRTIKKSKRRKADVRKDEKKSRERKQERRASHRNKSRSKRKSAS